MSISRLMQMGAAGQAGGPGAGNPWDISTATYNAINPKFNVGPQEATPSAVFFKPDGLKMYIVGTSGDDVNEYDLSTAWEISTASYLQNFSVSTEADSPMGLFFKPDGLKMYVLDFSGDDVSEYNLSTAWDISSASYLQNFSVNAQDNNPTDVFFKPDGLKMYIVGYTAGSPAEVNEYNLSTAWDVSTASHVQIFSVASQDSNPEGLFFRSDGLKMYVSGLSGDAVYEYNLSTAWDISTASYLQNFSVSAQEGSPSAVFFKPDGLNMYVLGKLTDFLYSYDLSTAWDITTAVFPTPENDYFDVSAQDTAPQGVFFKPDGLKMYVIGSSGDAVYEYDLSTAWDVSSASFLQNFSVSAQDTAPNGVFFKEDGLKMYVLGGIGDDVNEYDLSTAWDISTASYLRRFSVSAQDTSPLGFFFKPDGLKMYVIGSSGDAVYEYDLSTAWDISSASYLQNFSVVAQEDIPMGLFFKPDGLKMYVVGQRQDNIIEYDLSTAWDISSASYLQNFYVGQQTLSPTGVFFKPNGLKVYVIDNFLDVVYSYDL